MESLGGGDPENDDFGFHYPFSYVELIAEILERSNFSAWPEPGGVDDQDAFLLADMLRYLRLKESIRQEITPEAPDGKPGKAVDPFDVLGGLSKVKLGW